MKGENRHKRKLRKNLLAFVKDSSMATSWINEFFDEDSTTDQFSLIFTRKGSKPIVKSKPFDPTRFLENIKRDITEEVEDAFCDPDNDLDFKAWCDNYMANDDYANNLFTELEGGHPMERLSDPGDADDEVGVFSISYVEHLEKQNDLLRKNSKKKEGKNGKK